MVAALKTSPQVKEVEKHRKAKGLLGSIPDMVIKPNDRNVLAVLLPSQPEYEYPCFVPPEFTLCGPIVRPCAPIANEHPELARWIAQHPTVLVNLGSIAQFSPAMEREFAKALRLVLEVRGEAQVLWKLPRPTSSTSSSGVITDPLALELLSYYMAEGRLRTVTWLPVEPICLLQSGHIQCVLHHGGANAYHEAIRYGIRFFLSFATNSYVRLTVSAPESPRSSPLSGSTLLTSPNAPNTWVSATGAIASTHLHCTVPSWDRQSNACCSPVGVAISNTARKRWRRNWVTRRVGW